jgi:hypothetical protein
MLELVGAKSAALVELILDEKGLDLATHCFKNNELKEVARSLITRLTVRVVE